MMVIMLVSLESLKLALNINAVELEIFKHDHAFGHELHVPDLSW